MKYETKVERISGDLEKYLNEKGSQGWRCVSVTSSTGLGWTQIVVLERIVDDQLIVKYIDTPKQEDVNSCEKVVLEKAIDVQPENNNSEDDVCPNNDHETSFFWRVFIILGSIIVFLYILLLQMLSNIWM